MDNVLKKTIQAEIQNYMKSNNGSEACKSSGTKSEDSGSTRISKKEPKTQRRLGNLLNKIRSKSVESSKYTKRKIKKLQLRYQRYDPCAKDFKTVTPKDQGGLKFVDIECSKVVTFGEIRDKAQSLYFDGINGCNNFLEDPCELYITLNNMSGQGLDDDENIWDYLERKGEIISKTTLVLRSQAIDYGDVFSNFDVPDTFDCDNKLSTLPAKRKVCQLCSCTYSGNDCIICEQNDAYMTSLQKDTIKGSDQLEDKDSYFDTLAPLNYFPACSADDANQIDRLPDTVSQGTTDEERNAVICPVVYDPSPATITEVRNIRINHFTQSGITRQKIKDIRIHRMKVKGDLIKEFETVSAFFMFYF